MELGAGIGRFTGELAKHAGHVLAMDFMENLIKKVMKTLMDSKILCRSYVTLVLLLLEITRSDNCSFFTIKGD